MTTLFCEYPPGATPLNPDEIAGLKLSYISTQGELNTAEQQNILKAVLWAEKVKGKKDLLSDIFIRELHRHMFKNVWGWAGTYRTSDKSIGIDWKQVPEAVMKLCEDVRYWLNKQVYEWDELGCRFHHRLVHIHPFANGNGRHARLLTDLLLAAHGVPKFSWGAVGASEGLNATTELRRKYITSLQEADRRNFSSLIHFARS
jgi:Fic-DOC domain mobile mystery protein B